jgi:type IV pilus assembly protein PilY1
MQLGAAFAGTAIENSMLGAAHSAANPLTAHYGITHDINAAKTGDQKVQTFVVSLASPLPRIEIPVNGQKITLVPFAKSVGNKSINASKGAFQPTDPIVDFYLRQQPTATDGSFRVNFEAQEAGNDYDMDAIAEYTWHVNPTGTVTVTTSVPYALAGTIQHIGYVISGTTQDGVYLEVRDSDTDDLNEVSYYLDTPNPKTPGQCDPPSGCAGLSKLPSTRTFTPGSTSGATVLKDPLWYAAKWGGFKDQNNNGRPDLQDEWDANHNGIPDNYFLVTNALTLGTQLSNAFNEIIAVSSDNDVGTEGASVGVVAEAQVCKVVGGVNGAAIDVIVAIAGVHDVDAVATVKQIVATVGARGKLGQNVAAVAAFEHIVPGITRNDVLVRAAMQKVVAGAAIKTVKAIAAKNAVSQV